MDAEVGRRVHMLMWDQQLTQTTFGAQVGIDQSALAKKLRGQRGWSLDEVSSVASALGVSVGYLFGEGDGVGPAGIEPTTSTVEARRFAPIVDINTRRAG